MSKISLMITLAIITGQLIRIPLAAGGITVLDLVVLIACFIGLIKLKLHLKKPPTLFLAAFIFILIALISLVLTPLHLLSAQYFISFFYIVRFSSYILLGWLIYSKAFIEIKKINGILIYSGLGLAILGLLQFIFLPDLGFLSQDGWDPHYFRTVSTFLDPNFAGAYFVLTLILFFKRRATKVNITFFLITYFALLTTFSRSSYLMFLISGTTLSFLEKSKLLFIKVILLFLLLLAGFQIYTQLVSQPRHIDREKSASFRLSTWQQGWQLFQTYPILGVGFNSYRYALKELYLADDQFISTRGASSNDSSILFAAATTGVIGLIGYLIFLGSLFKKNVALKAAILGLLIHSIFANSLFFPPILLWLILSSL